MPSSVVGRILNLCLEIFEVNEQVRYQLEKQQTSQRLNSPRKIYPDTKYTDMVENTKKRSKMISTGEKWTLTQCSELGKACYFGHFHYFMKIVQDVSNDVIKKQINFNIWLECPSELSLMHLIIIGRRHLILDPENIVNKDKMDWKFEHFRIVKYLLAYGLDINIQNKWGYSVLHESLLNIPDLQIAKLLLNNGANPNQYTLFGSFPMIECATQSHIESVKLLCEHGADPRLLEYGSGITPISYSKHHVEMESIIYNALTKIRNKNKNKNKSHKMSAKQEQELEYENPSYCCVCGITSKIKSLYQCSRCCGPKRYCSKTCQKRDWKKHKLFCYRNRRKITNKKRKEKEIVFIVISKQQMYAEVCVADSKYGKDEKKCFFSLDLPLSLLNANQLEQYSEKKLIRRGMSIPKYQKKYQKKRNKAYNNKNKMNRSHIKVNYKFPIKIQIPIREFDNDDVSNMFCYNKSRSYSVFISNKGQKKKYNKLKKIIETQTDVMEKAYFYAYVDANNRLHVIISTLLAMQPW